MMMMMVRIIIIIIITMMIVNMMMGYCCSIDIESDRCLFAKRRYVDVSRMTNWDEMKQGTSELM